MKNKKDLIEIEKKLDKLPLWKLIIFTANIENSLISLKKQGLNSNEKIIKKRRWLRNTYRNLLRKKLNKWKKNPNKVNDVMDFDSVQIDKLNKEVNT